MKHFVLVFVTAVVLVGCSSGTPTPGGGGGGGGANDDRFTFDVDWTPQTTVVSEAQLALLKDADVENHRYTFDAAAVAGSNLDLSPGRILVVHGTSVRRISAVQEVGADLIVDTEYAPLTDAVANGTLGWDYNLDFSPEKLESLSVAGHTFTPTAEDTIAFNFKDGAFTYDLNIKLNGDRSDYTFTVTKGVGAGATAKFVAEGRLEAFKSQDKIVIENSTLKRFGHEQKGMRGETTLSLTVAGSGQDFVDLKLPFAVLKYPFLVGPIPVVLNVKIQFVVNAYVPFDGSSQVKTKFSFDSDMGFDYNGSEVKTTGQIGPHSLTREVAQTGASSAIGVNFGVGYPRVELGIAGETVVPWAQTAFLIEGSYSFMPPCQLARAAFIGAGGIDLKFFGLEMSVPAKTFFDQRRTLLRAGDCPPDTAAQRSLAALGGQLGFAK
jgi:hypothetical protein